MVGPEEVTLQPKRRRDIPGREKNSAKTGNCNKQVMSQELPGVLYGRHVNCKEGWVQIKPDGNKVAYNCWLVDVCREKTVGEGTVNDENQNKRSDI